MKENVAALRTLAQALTTAHTPSHTVTVSKKAKDVSKVYFRCPVVITEYTKYIGALNCSEQLTESLKSRKWCMWLFYFIFDCALVNIPVKATLVRKGQAHLLNHGPPSKRWRKILAFQAKPALLPHPISHKRRLPEGLQILFNCEKQLVKDNLLDTPHYPAQLPASRSFNRSRAPLKAQRKEHSHKCTFCAI